MSDVDVTVSQCVIKSLNYSSIREIVELSQELALICVRCNDIEGKHSNYRQFYLRTPSDLLYSNHSSQPDLTSHTN